jgi:hypothetical protein
LKRSVAWLGSLALIAGLTLSTSPASASSACVVRKGATAYGSVQEAVDAASNGDTLGLHGNCRGPVVTDKSLTLLGSAGATLYGFITATATDTQLSIRGLTLGISTSSASQGGLTLRYDVGGASISGSSVRVLDSYLTASTVSGHTVRVIRSTFNATSDRYSVSGGWVTVAESTITGALPSADYDSGAIYAGSRLHVVGSTIVGNIDIEGDSSGVANYEDAHVTVSSSILFNNSPADCAGVIQSGGYNIVGNLGNGQCQFQAQLTDQIGVDPSLFDLGYYGGFAPTFWPNTDSPAIDAIPVGAVAATKDHTPLCPAGSTDERGVVRPQGTGCDIGAVEWP